MPIALWCVLFAGVLPILTAGLAKRGDTSFDNGKPRAWEAAQDGWRRRAIGAQKNAFEAFPFFAFCVLAAWTQGGPQEWIDRLAIVYVVLRLAYLWAYVADRPTLRSAVWSLAFFVAIAIFTSPLWPAASATAG